MVDFEKGIGEASSSEVLPSGNADAPEPGNFVMESSKNKGLRKLVFIAGTVIVFLIIISILITSGTFSSKVISEKQLIVGASFAMEENKSLKVEIGEEEHEIEVQNVGEDWAEIVIRSDPIKFKLKVNEVIELDLDSDGQSDIRVKLFKIQDGKAILAVKRIDKQSCVEDWSCGGWEGCSGNKRERICTDKNNCGSEFFIPLHEQKCVGNNPVDVNESLKEVKGMDDTINFSDNVKVQSNTQDNESDDEINDTILEVNSPCLDNQYPCYEPQGYFCESGFSGNEYNPFCCLDECIEFVSKENYCNVRGKGYFEENQTHYCESGHYYPFNDTLINCCENIGEKSSFEYHIEYLNSIDCSQITSPECGVLNFSGLPKFLHSDSTGITTIHSFDEDCNAVCFGNAILNDCSPANIRVISNEGDSHSLSILGQNDYGGCSYRYTLEESSRGEETVFEGKSMDCEMSFNQIGLIDEAEIGCFPGWGDDPCLETLPGTIFGDVFVWLHVSTYFNEELDFNCTGDLVDLTPSGENIMYVFD